MRNMTLIAGFLFALISVSLPPAFAADTAAKPAVDTSGPPDATIAYEADQFRLILGGSSGKGVLHFKGKDYPFTMKGASAGGIGVTNVQGTGTVHNLKNVEDFAGNYTGIGIGAAAVKGGGSSSFQNAKGVVVSAKSKSDGLALNTGLSAVTVTLGK